MANLTEIFFTLDLAGTFVFAATGAFAAARKKHDIIAFFFFASVTGVGGGTIRDLLLNVPVFWIDNSYYIATCLIAALLVWLFGNYKFKFDVLTWLDAVGIAAFSVVGASKALSIGVSPLNAVIMGVITCVFGGLIRDTLANQPNMLLRREIYISAAMLGSVAFVGLQYFHFGFWTCAFFAALCAFILRAGAIMFGWQLPGFRKVAD
ncbi:MAG: trimeric intracellular cation channel family protein [Caulobacterales bacterium]|nr:trimeric intracellular cation channel family protein [Caulobacterales bacterium]